jgi:hypothetical protein
MDEKEQKSRYKTVDELMKDAKPCNIFKDVQKEIIKEVNSPEWQARENRKVVGAEGEN